MNATVIRPPLVSTGGPAVGKSSTAVELAKMRARAAVIDVDDIRQLVVSGAAAPWQGTEGRRQQLLGVENASALARNFVKAQVDVVIADVLTPETAPRYRRLLPGCLIVHLVVDLAEAQRRAATRKVHLTPEEFAELHHNDRSMPPPADWVLHVDELDLTAQVQLIDGVWRSSPS